MISKRPASPTGSPPQRWAKPRSPELPDIGDAGTATRRLVWIILTGIIASILLLSWLSSPFNFSTLQPWFRPSPGSDNGNTASHNANNTLGDTYLLGVGKADITGPVVEINLMGYADPAQVGTGLRQRLYSRAFIIGSPSKPKDRIVYLVLDTQSGDTAVRYGILRGIAALGPEYVVYGKHNVAVTGTHSHSGPGGWLNYLLPQVTSKGFDKQGYRAIVEGAMESVRRAHEGLVEGRLSVRTTVVKGAGINRSLYAYMANPVEERARYNVSGRASGDSKVVRGEDDMDDGSTDRNLTLLSFTRLSDNHPLGALTWFATHGTSMQGNNTLVSGDNKGVAAYLFERSMRDESPGFVAGFSQAGVGDVSPNVLGAWCDDGSGERCSFKNSTCPSDGRSQHCHARGPFFRDGDEGAKSCFEIGRRQFEPARKLLDRMRSEDHSPFLSDTHSKPASTPIKGDTVRAFHTYHQMPNFTFTLANGSLATTCAAALGYSFAAGTSDGPGVFDFTQHGSGEGNTSPVWLAVRNFLRKPSEAQKACHSPKPILLDAGEMSKPYEWTPNVVDVQVMRVGQLWIVVSSGEATTMASRRWRGRVRDAVVAVGEDEAGEEPVVVLGGPANSYTHYIATEEEYGVQRYEGASTLYGPHTLEAHINVTLRHLPMLFSLGSSSSVVEGNVSGTSDEPFPPDNSNRSLSFITGVVRDAPPVFKTFGDLLQDPIGKVFQRASNRDSSSSNPLARFVGANPRNNLRLEGTFAAVEKLHADSGLWETVRTDADWALVYRWRRTSTVLATSEVEIEWEVEGWAEPGVYRIRYYGDAKGLGGSVEAFEGVSGAFTVV